MTDTKTNQRLRRWWAEHPALSLWWATFVPCLLLMSSTAHWWSGRINDTQAADWGGWSLAHGYGNDLSRVAHLPQNPWFVHVGHRVATARTAGVVLSSVPLQWMLAPFRLLPDIPGVLTAVLLSSAAMANVAVLLHRYGGTRRQVLAFTAVLAFGTSIWTICGSELWTHGPDIFWLSCLMLALHSRRVWLAAGTVAPMVWTRPHLAVSIAILGLWYAWHTRSARTAVLLGGAGLASFAGLMAWNDWMFGTLSIEGATYESRLTEVTTAPGAQAGLSWLHNVAGAAVSPSRGFLLYSPVTLVVLVLVVRFWRLLPGAARASFLAGAGYLAVQYRLNAFTGGGGSFSNRLVVEAFVLSAPAAFLAYRLGAVRWPKAATLAYWLSAVSVTVHLNGALFAATTAMSMTPAHPWSDWVLFEAVRAAPAGLAIASLATAVVIAGFALPKALPTAAALIRRPVLEATVAPRLPSS